jgi:pimeloyl-ACP methyl ester carboxylesterase
MKMALRTGIEMFYRDQGSGEALILIPGTGCDHQIWGLQTEMWEREFRVIAVDNRGSGQSSIPPHPESYTVERMADDIADLIDQLNLGSAHLCGHSVGASIAQQVAVRHPEKVKSLQLHATFGRADEWFKNAFIATMRYPILNNDPKFCLKTCLMWAMSPDYLERRQPESAADMVYKCLVKNPHMNSDRGLLGHLHADEQYDALEQLEQIRVPVLITAGEMDYLVPKRYSIEVGRRIKHAIYHEFTGPQSSHFAIWEMPEGFAKESLDFMHAVSNK